jgi:hypothetical protein
MSSRRQYTFLQIIQKFFVGILNIFLWTFKHLRRMFGLKLFTFFILKPSLIYKSYKSLRWLINILITSIGGITLTTFNFLGIDDMLESILSFFRHKETNKQIKDIAEVVSSTKNKITEKIIAEDIPVVSESLRARYKNSFLDETSTFQKISALVLFALINAIIIYFFGPDILNFMKGFIPKNSDDDDSTPPAQPTNSNNAPETIIGPGKKSRMLNLIKKLIVADPEPGDDTALFDGKTREELGKAFSEYNRDSDGGGSGESSGSSSGASTIMDNTPSNSTNITPKASSDNLPLIDPTSPKSPVEEESAEATKAWDKGKKPEDLSINTNLPSSSTPQPEVQGSKPHPRRRDRS